MQNRKAASGFTPVELPAVSKRQCAAFTLVELLVVIGIITLLISFLLPALTKAKSAADTVNCMSNLRQVGLAFRMYSDANRGYLPFLYYEYTDAGGNKVGVHWYEAPVMGVYLGKRDDPSGFAPTVVRACPSFKYKDEQNWTPGYGYVGTLRLPDWSNPYWGWAGVVEWGWGPGVKLNTLRRSTERIMLGDSWNWLMDAEYNPWDLTVVPHFKPAGVYPWDGQGDPARHDTRRFDNPIDAARKGKANYVFADGHVDTLVGDVAANMISRPAGK